MSGARPMVEKVALKCADVLENAVCTTDCVVQVLVKRIILAVAYSAPLLLIKHKVVHNLPFAIVTRCARLLPHLVQIRC